MFWDILKGLLLLILGFIAYKFAIALKRQREWEAEGVVFSGPFSYFYDMYRLIADAIKYPHESFIMRLNIMYAVNGVTPAKIGIHVFGTAGIVFSEAKAIEQLFTTKNANYSKHEIERSLGAPLLNANIVSLQTEHPLYK